MNGKIISSSLSKSIIAKFLSCLTLTAFADVLFFKEEVGWTIGLFTVVLSAFYIILANPARITGRTFAILSLIIGQSLALFESPNLLSCGLVITGFAAIAYLHEPDVKDNAIKFLKFTWGYIWKLWTWLFRDSAIFLRYQKKNSRIYAYTDSIIDNSLIIAGLSIVFISLFAYANPVIAHWFKDIDLSGIISATAIYRMLFWLAFASLIWAIIRPRRIKKNTHANVPVKFKPQDFLLTNISIAIALVLFNTIFLVQNIMDAGYFLLGRSLPDGMTYAQYAHSGAYPLMITALISIVFVLVILKPGRGSEQSALIRNLIYLWVVQNIFLVFGSAWRTCLYIDIYHLTLLRISALIWMGLVGTGFILIIVRIAKNKTNLWLINSNFITLIVTLYICSFVNFSGIIAEYNVDHSKEMGGSEIAFDASAVNDFNAIETLPALSKLNKHNASANALNGFQARYYSEYEGSLKDKLQAKQQNWHSWTFRNYRIQKQIENME